MGCEWAVEGLWMGCRRALDGCGWAVNGLLMGCIWAVYGL
jgi:hypothetical protein